MECNVTEVRSRKELMEFIRFPDSLYAGCPQYVPALHSDQVKSLTSVSTLDYCTHILWVARDSGGKVVGRISAMINPRYNERYSTRRARFGWFDTIDDFEVAKLLLDTAEQWAAEQGMEEIHGPLYYNTLGKQGMLVEGFENIPPFNCLYNYPYYNDFVLKLGYAKECDWVQYKVNTSSDILPDKVRRVAELVRRRYDVHPGKLSVLKRDYARMKEFFDVYNKSFASSVYNFVPFTDDEIREEIQSVKAFISDNTSCVLFDRDENIVAFGITFPSISKALQKAGGRLFPFGWLHLLRAMHNYETTDLMLNGAVPEWQAKGISSVYSELMAAKSRKCRTKWGITNPQIETNQAVNIWKNYDSEPYMRRRCYVKKIAK